MGTGGKVWAAGVASVRPGTPLCWTQLDPASSNGPTAGHVWAPQARWCHLTKNRFEKGQNTAQAEEVRGKKIVRNCSVNTKVKGGEEVLQALYPWRGPVLEWGKVWGGRSGSEELLWIDCKPHSPSPCATQGGGRDKSWMKDWSWAWEGGVWGWCCFGFFFVPHYPNLF